MFKPLEKRRYSEQIAHLIQEKIMNENIQKDNRLPTERELAQEFQVSRTVIREAMRELEVSGLVHIKKGPTGGIFITHAYHKPLRNSLQNLIASGRVTADHILEVRLLIEPYIVTQAALHANTEDIDELQVMLTEAAQHRDDAATLKSHNFKFHPRVAKASGNPVFSILIDSVMEILEEIAHDFLDLSIERSFLQAHQEIFRAIKEKDLAKIKRLVEEDIRNVNTELKTFFENHKDKPV